MDLDVTLEELFLGTEIDVEINRQIICPHCRGSGAKNADDVRTCNDCGGAGFRILRQQIAMGIFQQMQVHCDTCGGKGKIIASKCPHCNGAKVKRGNHQFTVAIEKGMTDGQALTFEREADQDPEFTPGDVVC